MRVRPWAQEKNRSTGDTLIHVDTFRKHVEFLPRAPPNKIVHPAPPSNEVLLVPGAPDMHCGVLERSGKSFTLHIKTRLLAPCPPSLHQPAKSLLEVPYPVSLPGISVAIWMSIVISSSKVLQRQANVISNWITSSRYG